MKIQEASRDLQEGGIFSIVPRQFICRRRPKTSENRRIWAHDQMICAKLKGKIPRL